MPCGEWTATAVTFSMLFYSYFGIWADFGSYLFSVVRYLFVFGETGEKLYTTVLISCSDVSLQRELANINDTVRLLEILSSFF